MIFGPVAEEGLFRGVLWAMIASRYNAGSSGRMTLYATSLLFAVSHAGYWAHSYWPLPVKAYLHILIMVPAGFFFGYVRRKSGSLVFPVGFHSLANGMFLFFQ